MCQTQERRGFVPIKALHHSIKKRERETQNLKALAESVYVWLE